MIIWKILVIIGLMLIGGIANILHHADQPDISFLFAATGVVCWTVGTVGIVISILS